MTLFDLTAVPDAPAPTSGPVHRTILVVDIEGSTRRTDPVKGALRQILYEIIEQSVRASGFAAHRVDELVDRGDGLLALFRPSPQTPKALLLTLLVPWLTRLLREHNARYPALAMRLRATIHAGEVHQDRHGPYGEAIDLACRLLDTPELRRALRINHNPTALAVSDDIYRTVVRHCYAGIDATAYHPVIHVDLAGQTHRGWLHTPGRSDQLGRPILGIEVSDLQLWAKLLALAILALVIIGLVAGLGGTADELRSMVDPDGVTFRIDKDGVYTGGAHPTLVTSPTIRDVELADFVDANSSADTDIVAPFSRVTFTTTGPTIQRRTPGDLSAIETIVRRYAPTATVRRTFNVQ